MDARWSQHSVVKIVLCSTVYIATSFFGFLLFGYHTLDDLLDNFDGVLEIPYGSLHNDVVRVSYVTPLMLVFPIVLFSLRLNMDGLFFPYAIPFAYDNCIFLSVIATLICLIFLGKKCVPNIWDAFQFTSATATIFVGYILRFYCPKVSTIFPFQLHICNYP